MTKMRDLPYHGSRRIKWPLRLTFAGLLAERVMRVFWPLFSIILVALGLLMLEVHTYLVLEVLWVVICLIVGGALVALVWGARVFQPPRWEDAVERLDATIAGRPIAALTDTQAIGAGDAASESVWHAHVRRMAKRLDQAKSVKPDLRLARRDPFALRYLALLIFTVAVLFGSALRVSSVAEAVKGGPDTLAGGPVWEGWVEPPIYTGKPSLYLNDIDEGGLAVPVGSQVTVRFYGEVGALVLHETVSARTEDLLAATNPAQSFEVLESGEIRIDGPGGRVWSVTAIEDQPPEIEFEGPISRGEGGRVEAPFIASDDYGVTNGRLEITLDLGEVDRRFGLSVEPEPREAIVIDLPLSISGDRRTFSETVIEDFSTHPWANLPVSAELFALDAAGQETLSAPQFAELPGQRFFVPLAKAVAEMRRDLLWNRVNAPRVAQVLRAISFTPDNVFQSETTYLKLRFLIRRLETSVSLGPLEDADVEEFADVLWSLAMEIEHGRLSDALERLRRAQDRLSEAMRNGASDEEIAELMQELREAMQDYMRQLAEQQGDNPQNQDLAEGERQEITGEQLQDMLDRLQELMEQGRMAEAQQLLQQLQQMMENMQVTQGGEGQQSPGQQSMEELADTLREQQGLSDEAFRDLQEQFNAEGNQRGNSAQNQGRDGDQGRGQLHGQNQEGAEGQQQQGDGEGMSLADRQRALRDNLRRQQQNVPGSGDDGGSMADALDRAGRAMESAEDALRNEDFAEALDNQSEAMEGLREAMRELAEQLAEQNQPGQQQNGQNTNAGNSNRDPLGRDVGQNGRSITDEQLLQGEDVYRRAREILDEIRKRSGEQDRPTLELDYLKRLLDRF